MNKDYKLLTCLIITLSIYNNSYCLNNCYKNAGSEKKYVISGFKTGFFSNFIGMLNHLLYAETNGLTPVIYWGPRFLFYEPTAPNGNAWDYYFEPVSHLKYEPGDKLENLRYEGTYQGKELWLPTYWTPNGYQFPYNTSSMFDQHVRNLGNRLINKYIKPVQRIQSEVDNFYEQYMKNKQTVGIHLRGSDKYTEVGYVNHLKMLIKANEVARNLGPNTQFFVATDEEKLLNLAKIHLNGTIIHCDTVKVESLASISHVVTLQHELGGNVNKLDLGEEVFKDALILARCDAMINSLSLVSQGVSYINPNMPCYLVHERHSQSKLARTSTKKNHIHKKFLCHKYLPLSVYIKKLDAYLNRLTMLRGE